MRSVRTMWVGVGVALLGCGEASRARACDPVAGTGCRSDLACVVLGDGAPACRALAAGRAVGDVCDAPDQCPPGSGCVSVEGLARCAPFCRPDTAAGDGTCVAAAGPDARCFASLPGRPDIGLCVFVCGDPSAPFTPPVEGAPAPCPGPPDSGQGCVVPASVRFAVCSATVGGVGEAAPCGGEARCGSGLLCVPRGSGGVCRAVQGAGRACAEDERPSTYPGGGAYTVCEPCPVVTGPQREDPPGTVYALCHASEPHAEAAARCEREGGRLVEAGDPALAALAAAASAEEGALWLAGCRSLDPATGQVAEAPCDATARALCRLAPE